MSEDQLQSSCILLAWNNYPQTRRLLFSVPNGGYRNSAEAAKLKATGLVPGIPDLLLLWQNRPYGFELKVNKGVLSDAQKKVHEKWIESGVYVSIIRSVEQFENELKKIIL